MAQPILTDEWMRIGEAADQIGCHHKTLYRRFARNSVAGVRVLRLSGLVRIHRQDWAVYLERHAAAQQEKAA